MEAPHRPVLAEETIEILQPAPGLRFIDGTFGYGGHAQLLLAGGAEVLGLDLDAEAVAACERVRLRNSRLHCRRASFRDLDGELDRLGWPAVDGLLLDLGVSSRQLDDPAQGFSYRFDGPLDLRFDQRRGETAAALLARLNEAELSDLLRRYGQERAAGRIARAIVAARRGGPVRTTGRLRQVVQAAAGRGVRPMATLSRVFQALRIAVNDELGALADVLAVIPTCVRPGGRVVIISYHSLEDRMVKRWMERESRDCLCPPELPACRCGHRRRLRLLARKALRPAPAEVDRNKRARSARLRAAEMLPADGRSR